MYASAQALPSLQTQSSPFFLGHSLTPYKLTQSKATSSGALPQQEVSLFRSFLFLCKINKLGGVLLIFLFPRINSETKLIWVQISAILKTGVGANENTDFTFRYKCLTFFLYFRRKTIGKKQTPLLPHIQTAKTVNNKFRSATYYHMTSSKSCHLSPTFLLCTWG